ncbi:MAG: polyprenyl synthetase family protein [Desulfobacterales bacterium]|nr:polyprenyl synthetase family protein [Desulfobacterales bacterium]
MASLKQKILEEAQNDLIEIEKELIDNLDPYLDVVKDIAKHILFSGGKRLRPLLFVLWAKICNYNGNIDKKVSVIFEYLHAASLLHDDLVDGAEMRRKKKVANLMWNNSAAVLVGDFLLAKALNIASQTSNLDIIKSIADSTEMMTQGEIHQLFAKENINLTEDEYMKVIQSKTAVLIQGACKSGAIIAGASKSEQESASIYGLNLGVAFQIVDDLLDYTADAETLGKNIGADLKEGKLTLPVIYALKRADLSDKKFMERIIKNKNFSLEEFNMFKDLLNKYKGIAYSENAAKQFALNAKEAISAFNQSKAKNILLMLGDYTLIREE